MTELNKYLSKPKKKWNEELDKRAQEFIQLNREKGFIMTNVGKITENIKKDDYNFDKLYGYIIQKNVVDPYGKVFPKYYFLVYNEKLDDKKWWSEEIASMDKNKGKAAAMIPEKVVRTVRANNHHNYIITDSSYVIATPMEFFYFRAVVSNTLDQKKQYYKHALIMKTKMVFILAELLETVDPFDKQN